MVMHYVAGRGAGLDKGRGCRLGLGLGERLQIVQVVSSKTRGRDEDGSRIRSRNSRKRGSESGTIDRAIDKNKNRTERSSRIRAI